MSGTDNSLPTCFFFLLLCIVDCSRSEKVGGQEKSLKGPVAHESTPEKWHIVSVAFSFRTGFPAQSINLVSIL